MRVLFSFSFLNEHQWQDPPKNLKEFLSNEYLAQIWLRDRKAKREKINLRTMRAYRNQTN